MSDHTEPPTLKNDYPDDNPLSRLDAAHRRLDAAQTPEERDAAMKEIDEIRNGVVGIEMSGTDADGTLWVI